MTDLVCSIAWSDSSISCYTFAADQLSEFLVSMGSSEADAQPHLMAATINESRPRFLPDNFDQSSGVLLRARGGFLPLEGFVEVFGRDAPEKRRLSFLAWTTGHTTRKITADWCALVLFRKPARAELRHRRACDRLFGHLEAAGIDIDAAGIDRAARSPFYMVPIPFWAAGSGKPVPFEGHNLHGTDIIKRGLKV